MAVKIGPCGEFASADDIAWSAQQLFFQAMQCVYPEPLRVLRDDIYPEYAEWVKTVSASGLESASIRTAGESRVPGSASPVLNSFLAIENTAPKLRGAILHWANRFHLIGEMEVEPEFHGEQWQEIARVKKLWPCSETVWTLFLWHSTEAGSARRRADPPQIPIYQRYFGATGQGQVHLPHWFPELETDEEYRKHLGAIIDEYLTARKQQLRMAGAVPIPAKKSLEHFEWAVLYQVAQRTYAAIAQWHQDTYPEADVIGDDTVRHGVEHVAKLMRLQLRRGRTGPVRGKTKPRR